MKRVFQPDESNPGLWMTKRYSFALVAIALIAVCAFGTVGLLIAEHKSTLSVVNISGRQRMLSQRTALYVSQLIHTKDRAAQKIYREELQKATQLLEQAHLALTGQNNTINVSIKMSPQAQKRYFQGANPLNEQMQDYLRTLHQILNLTDGELTPDHPLVHSVLTTAPGELLDALDAMVEFYQHDGESAFAFLQKLEAIFLSLTIFILAMEVIFIFRPMVYHVSTQMQRIKDFSKELEARVIRRTAQLDEARKIAEDANKAKSTFLASAGHDLKQPLEAIGMFSGMLEKRMPDDLSRAIMKDMHNAQRSMRSLLDSILSLSKLEAGVIEPIPTTFALQPLFDQLTQEYRAIAQQKGLAFIMVPTRLNVTTDPLLLERILRNILSNAVRYTKEGRILMGCRRKGGHIAIDILDTGLGIPQDSMENIFTEFSQLDDPERDRSEGIGLGLAIVKRLCKLLNLDVHCQSNVDKGSRFTILLQIDT
ncbi:MAG: type IV pili methyl-accepting chemotaxis transducer N-terminal domain-containing protein [Methylocystaceae bacterium]|nr:type IV pili methyl-accepting chemotaxis transducer N-terminal domain-containing protein [Methylocystaceae bacterium]